MVWLLLDLGVAANPFIRGAGAEGNVLLGLALDATVVIVADPVNSYRGNFPVMGGAVGGLNNRRHSVLLPALLGIVPGGTQSRRYELLDLPALCMDVHGAFTSTQRF